MPTLRTDTFSKKPSSLEESIACIKFCLLPAFPDLDMFEEDDSPAEPKKELTQYVM